MATTLLTIKVEESDKKKAQKLAKQLGFSLSGVMKAYLQKFLREKRLNVGLELTDWAKEELRKSKQDVKAGRVVSFEDGKAALAYLDKLIEEDERTAKN